MQVRKLIWASAVLVVPALLAMGETGAASAAVTGHAAPAVHAAPVISAPHMVTVRIPMVYKPAPGSHARPNNTTHGSCGSAFLGLAPIGEGKVVVNMGFDINEPAYGEAWTTVVNDQTNSGSGILPPWSSESWDYDYQVTTGVGAVASVAEYWAELYGGGQCVSTGLYAVSAAN